MQKTSKRVLAIVLVLVMALSVFSISAAAYTPGVATTHTVFKHTESTLAPGVEQYINYAYANDGEQNVYFVTTADISRDDVVVQTSYMDQYRDKKLGMSKLTDQVASANEYYSDPASPQFISEYYNVVAGVNASFYNMTTGQPNGICWIDGVNFGTNAYPAFFAILKDGTAVIDDRGNAGKYDIWQAVGGSQWLVRDGQDVTGSATGSYNTDRHCRTAVGITAEGKVVTMALDGRQSPYSIGGSMHEIAQIMLEADCVYAINLDGGGSTTYVAKQEGEDSVKIVDRPSDGSERAISAGLIIASTAAPSNVFDHANLTAEDEYISVNASTAISAKGISPAGTSAEIPADAVYVCDNGTVTADGTFTPAAVGDAVIRLVSNDKVVGETVVHVVVPDSIEFSVATLAAPYGKDADITMIAKYGEFNFEVKCTVDDYAFALSDAKYGTVDGFVFHATDDTTVTGSGTITATFVGSDRTATVPLSVGKGSEVLFDFEDDADNHHTSRWSGYDGYNAGIVTTCTPVTAANGKVHSGDYAMAYDMDFSQLTYYEDYTYSLMCYNWDDIAAHGFTKDTDGVQQRGATEDYVDITGATGLGMWMYIPDEVDVRGLDVRYTIGGKKTATANWERVNSVMGEFFPYRAGLGTDGWYYYYFDLSNYSSWAGLRLQNCRTSNSINKNGKNSQLYGDVMQLYVNDRAWKDADKQFKSYTSHVTLYIDDITVDYSSVVPDREAPVFTNPTYAFAGASDAIALNNNASIGYSGLEFAVAVAENTKKTNASGLDTAGITAMIDGMPVNATYQNGKLAVPTYNFADGTHTVTFYASDKTGNTSHLTRTFTVNAGADIPTVKVVARDADLAATPVGSLYYIDLVATDAAQLKSATATLKVNNVNDWEPEGIETAKGFEAQYEISNFDKGLIDLTVTKNGETDLTGEAVIASIPVRTWYPHNALGKDSNWLITQKKCVYPMDTQVFTKAGAAVYGDDIVYFGAPTIQCDSESMCEYGYIGVNKGNEGGTNVVTSWHTHNAQPMADKAAACEEAGYTGRTFCADCNSVIEWGTTVPATGHSYAVTDGVLKCAYCGELYNGEFTDGKLYVDGIPAQGWIDNKYYADGEYLTGLQLIDDLYYMFGEDGTSQGTYTGSVKIGDEYGFAQNGALASGWIYDDEWYYIDPATMRAVPEKTFGYPNSKAVTTYQFEETGKIVTGVWVELAEGTRYYYGPDYYKLSSYVHANVANVQFETIDGETYGFNKLGYRYEGLCFLRESNSDLELYEFTDEGVMIGKYTGVYQGKYFENGVVTGGKGLIKEGGDYYYVKSGGSLFADGSLFISDANTNGLVSAGNYQFDAEGKMILRNGIVNGYYFENGSIVKGKGLIELDGDIYFIGQQGQVVKSMSVFVSEAKANGILQSGNYKFNDEGKLIRRNGIVDGYYFENDVLVKGKGLVKLDGDFYYIGQQGQVVKSMSIFVSEAKANGLVAAGDYKFDADGKMILKNGFIDGYYYVDGKLTKAAHLVKIGDDLYYVNRQGKAFVGNLYISTANANGLVPAGNYVFGADGRMVTG